LCRTFPLGEPDLGFGLDIDSFKSGGSIFIYIIRWKKRTCEVLPSFQRLFNFPTHISGSENGVGFGRKRKVAEEILIPNHGAMLAFDYRAAWTAFPSNTVRVRDVSIEHPDTNEVLEIHPLIISISNNSSLDTSNKTERVDLSKYAVETVSVSFGAEVEVANGEFGMIQFDHVRLEVEVSYALSVIHDPENGFTISLKNLPLGRLVLEQRTDVKNWIPFLTRNVHENTGAILFNYQVESELEQTYQSYRVSNE
jgi:hypothetical protein